MVINLKKGQSIVLDKTEYDLSQLMMGLGWDVSKKSVLGNFFGGGADFDLDAYAILLTAENKVKNYKEDVVYYGHLQTADKSVRHSGDNLTGEGAGDDECIFINLNDLSQEYEKIILGVTIYQAKERKQHFGMVHNAFVRAVDARGIEIARYDLSGNDSYMGRISMLMAEAFRHPGGWNFRALGEPLETDLNGIVGSFMR